ncbi:pyk10-binding protein 1 [Moniliophthora roreri MCA 2997]|uniref:Pyk10-binding protein 1 n=1 Tax=Moniliophthora roreri (strain MCA 2997) TaxID=1381753 RepID=V2WQA6_MONRO|nr:pyk10-binding protein 1 [Moniliophthora roreri MCA 2997]
MSELPSDFPQVPKSVDGQELPDFIKGEIIQRGIKLPFSTVPDRYDFTIKHSDCFGTEAGDPFDEGATWYPLKLVQITSTAQGLSSYQARYAQNVTGLYGKAGDANELKLSLDEDEYITGISGTFTDVVTSLQIRTTKQEQRIGTSSGTQFEFNVPEDHHVVGFFGRADDQLRAFGVAYNRRLESLTKDAPPRAGPAPDIKPIYSEVHLDAATKQQWRNNDFGAINAKREAAKQDLAPLYEDIKNNGSNAWYELGISGERYYFVSSIHAIIWAYVKDEQSAKQADDGLKTSIISIGSYSANAGIVGLSGYVWNNLPINLGAAAIAMAFTVLLQPLIAQGIAWGIAFAAAQLAQAAAAAGLPALAALVPASVATLGGLIIGAIIGVALFFAVMWLADFLFRQYLLTVEVFNFDSDHVWNSISWYSDNAQISNDEWKTVPIPKYAPAGNQVYPPGFYPPTTVENVVTYLSIAFINVNTFLEGLGIAILLGRDDGAQGLALQYFLPRFGNNQIGLQAINGNPNNFNLGNNYNNGYWVTSNTTSANVGSLPVTGYTPYLQGAPDNAYNYIVKLGSP